MSTDPYYHEHTHVEEVSWPRLGRLLMELAEQVGSDWQPEMVVGVAKGGVIPAVFLSSAFRVDFLPIKLSSRRNEEIVSEEPIWYVHPTRHVQGRRVLLVDDIAVVGRTLSMAQIALEKEGAVEVRTATLAVHRAAVRPRYSALATDALIVWPWDRDVFSKQSGWMTNPEYLGAMERIPGYRPPTCGATKDKKEQTRVKEL